ncbi:MAG: hypothetical protein AAFV26_03610 [Pseudomonadota bacterium]
MRLTGTMWRKTTRLDKIRQADAGLNGSSLVFQQAAPGPEQRRQPQPGPIRTNPALYDGIACRLVDEARRITPQSHKPRDDAHEVMAIALAN